MKLLDQQAAEFPPSLDLGRNDCNSTRYDCREIYSNFYYIPDVDEEIPEDPPSFRCGQWDCYCCGYRMRMNLVEELRDLVEQRPEMRRLMTLTLDPKKLPQNIRGDDKKQAKYLMDTWRKFRVYIRREYGDFSFVWVKEKQENGNWHLHALVSRYLDQNWISEAWSSVGGGKIVDIQRIDRVEKVANYVGKYLTKDALSGFPRGIQRYGASEDIELEVRSSDGSGEWDLVLDDFTIYPKDESNFPLTRPVDASDFVAQREWGGPKPPPQNSG